MVTITDRAVDRLKSLSENTKAVELSVVGGGCSGMSYNFKFTDREPNDRDRVYEFENVKLLVQLASYVYLADTEVDFSDDLLNGGFKFNNPQTNRECGCGISFSV